MKAPIGRDTHIMTTIATTMADAMIVKSLARPTAVNTESSENTMSMRPICRIVSATPARGRSVPGPARALSSEW